MADTPRSAPPLARLLPAAAVLGVFYLGLFRYPPPSASQSSSLTQNARQAVEQAWGYMRDKRYREALKVFRELHAMFPTNHTYASSLAEVYRALGNPEREASAWEAYLEFAPLPIEACPHWPRALEQAHKTKEAFAAYQRCYEFDTEDPDGIFFYAHALERSGQSARARELYERGHSIDPRYLDIALGLARMQMRVGKFADALALVEPVLLRSPNNSDALLAGGLAALRCNQLDKAQAWLSRGQARKPDSADFPLALGLLAERQGRAREAADWLERALRLNPDSEDAVSALHRVKKKI